MHELGVVFHMVDLLEDAARENGLSKITKVTVSLGEVSGVVTDFFEDAWLWASQRNDLLKDAELVIYQITAVNVCNDCGRTYEAVAHGRTCPHCNSPRTEILHGTELEIDSIEGF